MSSDIGPMRQIMVERALRGACPLHGLETQNGIKMVVGVSKTHGIKTVFNSNYLYGRSMVAGRAQTI